MSDGIGGQSISEYWDRKDLAQTVRDALSALSASGPLTVDALAPLDQFHPGGKSATERLARLAGLRPGSRVLDVGGGLGGPARTLAVQYGCEVTVVDVTESYLRAGEILTGRLGLGDRVTHQLGDALDLPFDAGSFDVVWMQNSGMNIADKPKLYRGIQRVLHAGGVLAIQEPMAGPAQPMRFPIMWAADASSNFLLPSSDAQRVIEGAGFRVRAFDDVTSEVLGPPPEAPEPAYFLPRIVMGDALPEIMQNMRRNGEEGRVVNVQAVFERV
jgi:SAM-dependent methyltransferase